MALTPLITATQSIAYPSQVTFVDASGGSDGTITNRKIWVTAADDTVLADGVDWAYASSSKVLDILTTSTSPTVTVIWYAGATVTYTYTTTFCFDIENYTFMLGILAALTSAPKTIQDTFFYGNSIQFIVNLWNAENAIEQGGDIWSSQNSLNLNQTLINNSSLYF